MVAITPQVLAVNPELPVKSLKELIALAKTKPGVLVYASSGVGSMGHISGALMSYMGNIQQINCGKAIFNEICGAVVISGFL